MAPDQGGAGRGPGDQRRGGGQQADQRVGDQTRFWVVGDADGVAVTPDRAGVGAGAAPTVHAVLPDGAVVAPLGAPPGGAGELSSGAGELSSGAGGSFDPPLPEGSRVYVDGGLAYVVKAERPSRTAVWATHSPRTGAVVGVEWLHVHPRQLTWTAGELGDGSWLWRPPSVLADPDGWVLDGRYVGRFDDERAPTPLSVDWTIACGPDWRATHWRVRVRLSELEDRVVSSVARRGVVRSQGAERQPPEADHHAFVAWGGAAFAHTPILGAHLRSAGGSTAGPGGAACDAEVFVMQLAGAYGYPGGKSYRHVAGGEWRVTEHDGTAAAEETAADETARSVTVGGDLLLVQEQGGARLLSALVG